jgi:hypothetical protein
MTGSTTPPSTALFTPEDVASFCRAVAGWVQRGLCGAVLRVRADDADVLLVMRGDGSPDPLWAVEKHPDHTYWLVNRSRQALAFGATIDDVLGYLALPEKPARAAVH